MATMFPYFADYDAKRRILEIVRLNRILDGATPVPEIRKPFDVLAEGLISEKKSGRPDLNLRPPELCSVVARDYSTMSVEFFVPFFVLVAYHVHKE
jgi:hypothetical protein